MNHYAARQRESDKRWDYTCQNGTRIHPVGYCAGKLVDVMEIPEDEREPYHEHGHDTPEAARECYKRYMLDSRLRLDGKMSDQKRMCEAEGCEEWTQGVARVGPMISFVLCDDHRTRETVETLYSVGDSWSSY